jgi:Xaa-Pro aminopeptidase
MTEPVARGFERAEFEHRLERAQAAMHAAGLDALLLTIEANVRYFTGFDTQFWASPTRPWFVVAPRQGAPIAIVPELGREGMAATWVSDIRTWQSPRPADDGVSLVAAALEECAGRAGRVGAELGPETSLRMPVNDLARLRGLLGGTEIVDGSPLIRDLRMVKSAAEVARIRTICGIVSEAFAALPAQIGPGISEREACRRLRVEILRRGADASPYLMGTAGPGGYDNIIMGPTDRVMESGDVLIIDTGSTFDGYYSDFDRNFAIGPPSEAARRAHDAVWRATEAGIAAVRPGARVSEVWREMMAVMEAAGSQGNQVGRMGHGLGLQLTEPPSLMPGDDTEIVPGMVLTVEPGMAYAPGKMIVHEENLIVTGDGNELLTQRAPREMWVAG